MPRILSFALILSGLALFLGNELRALFATMDLAFGRNAVISISATRPDSANEGKTVHVIGQLTTPKPATDATLGVSGDYASLNRIVEMNQWSLIPRRRSASRDTLSANGFELRWSPLEVDTRRENAPPEQLNPSMALHTQQFFAEGLQIGDFSIDRDQISLLGTPIPVPISEQLGGVIARALPDHTPAREGDWTVLSPAPPSSTTGRPIWPLGAYRIRFEQVPLAKVTIVARQRGQNLTPFGSGVGPRAFLVRDGEHPIEAVFDEAETSNRVLTWGFRFVGIALVLFGLLAIVRRRK